MPAQSSLEPGGRVQARPVPVWVWGWFEPLIFKVPCVQSLGWVWLEAACFGSEA